MDNAKKLAAKAAKEEKKLAKIKQEFALANPEFANFLKQQDAINKKINDMWAQVKNALVEAGYTDVIENELFRISISPVFAFEADVNQLPDEYTETVKVPIKHKIKKFYELYGELPKGAVNTSYYRLNKKVKE